MKKQLFTYLFIGLSSLLVLSCKKVKLDALAFPYESLDSYSFDEYEGEIEVPSDYDISMDKVHLFSLDSKDENSGETYQIYAVYVGDTNQIATDTVILYCHGQSKHMDNYWSRAKLLANVSGKNQYGLLMMDYRGYGMSEGSPTEQGMYEDVEACIDWLSSKGAQANKTFYYGYSLGCIPVIEHAAYKSDFKPAKIIIESPLASVENLTQSSTLINVDSKFMTSLEFNNAEKIKDVNMPMMWLHGVEDSYIQISNGELIYNNYQGVYKEAHRIEEAEHSNIPVIMTFEEYITAVSQFIRL